MDEFRFARLTDAELASALRDVSRATGDLNRYLGERLASSDTPILEVIEAYARLPGLRRHIRALVRETEFRRPTQDELYDICARVEALLLLLAAAFGADLPMQVMALAAAAAALGCREAEKWLERARQGRLR